MQGYLRGIGAMKTSLAATLTQISFRVAATLLLVPRMGISGVALACVIGWSAMSVWTFPWRIHLRKSVQNAI
jgi:Na+-driven multidrug efflux pump